MPKYLLLLVCFLLTLRTFTQVSEIDSLATLVETAVDPVQKVDLSLKLSAKLVNSNVGKALSYSLEALNIARNASYRVGMVKASISLAKIYYYSSDLDKAMEFALQAKNLAEDIGDQLLLASSLDAIGMIYYDIGNQAKSSEYFFESLKIYEAIKDKEGLGGTYCRIGTLYLDQKDYDKAEDYYTKSIQIAREINLPMGIASNLNNLAKLYYNKGDYSRSLQLYQEALSLNLSNGEFYLAGNNYLNLADVYIKLNENPIAIDNLNKAREIFVKIGNKLRDAKSMVMLSEIYLKNGQEERSEELAKQALNLGQRENFKDIIASASRILYEYNIEQKDSAAALKYFALEKSYQDSLSLDEKQKNLKALELQYQFDKEEQAQKIARQKRIVIISIISGGVFFSLIILVLLVRYFRLKARKLQLEKAGFERELEFKNKELVLNVMSLMQKNEILADLSQKLISIDESATTPESKDTIRKVARELQKSQDKEIWKEFSHRFKEIHGDFYDKLLQKFPDLTPNELKLCAFLRLNMSSKDIGELTGQRVSSLETARYRLRQKLGIANSDINLVTFLSSF